MCFESNAFSKLLIGLRRSIRFERYSAGFIDLLDPNLESEEHRDEDMYVYIYISFVFLRLGKIDSFMRVAYEITRNSF